MKWSAKQVQKIMGAKTMGQVARTVPTIYAALEYCQVDHKSTLVEVKGKISKKYISILIDPGYTHSYTSPFFFIFVRLRDQSMLNHG